MGIVYIRRNQLLPVNWVFLLFSNFGKAQKGSMLPVRDAITLKSLPIMTVEENLGSVLQTLLKDIIKLYDHAMMNKTVTYSHNFKVRKLLYPLHFFLTKNYVYLVHFWLLLRRSQVPLYAQCAV